MPSVSGSRGALLMVGLEGFLILCVGSVCARTVVLAWWVALTHGHDNNSDIPRSWRRA